MIGHARHTLRQAHGWFRRRAERGVNVVEFALVLPILLLLVAGIADFGRAFYAYIAITNASREGARLGSHTPWLTSGPNSIELATEAELANAGIDSDYIITVTCRDRGSAVIACLNAISGDSIRVEVEYSNFEFILANHLPPPLSFGDDHLTIRNTTEMVVFGIISPPE